MMMVVMAMVSTPMAVPLAAISVPLLVPRVLATLGTGAAGASIRPGLGQNATRKASDGHSQNQLMQSI
jgi:hypothetical protein